VERLKVTTKVLRRKSSISARILPGDIFKLLKPCGQYIPPGLTTKLYTSSTEYLCAPHDSQNSG
jgi:hypothetical protein